MNTSIILLYGLLNPARKDIARYHQYLQRASEDINKTDAEKLILCGGFTDPKNPHLSEASTVQEYLKDKLTLQNIVLEDQSITTNQNLEFAATLVNGKEDSITVYCDLARQAKVTWAALHFLLKVEPREIYTIVLEFATDRDPYKNFHYNNLTIKGIEYSQNKEEILGQTHASIIDVMALFDTEMEKMELEQRKKDFGIT